MLINFVDTTNDANHYTKPPPIPKFKAVTSFIALSNISWKNGRESYIVERYVVLNVERRLID